MRLQELTKACRRMRDKASYIGEEKKGATPVLGISLSASSQCAPPTPQLTRHETLAWDCYRSVEKMSILFAKMTADDSGRSTLVCLQLALYVDRMRSASAAFTAALARNAPRTSIESMVANANSGVTSSAMLARPSTLISSVSPAARTASRSRRA